MKAAIYARVSSEEQRERQTIQTQREFAKRYCDRLGIAIADSYSDDGISGTLPLERRPEGARLLADANAGKIDLVLVYRVDRLGREAWVTLKAMHDLENAGAKVQSMTKSFN